MTFTKGFAWLPILIVVGLIIIGAAVYVYSPLPKDSNTQPEVANTDAPSQTKPVNPAPVTHSTTPPAAVPSMLKYDDSNYGFSISYPTDLQINTQQKEGTYYGKQLVAINYQVYVYIDTSDAAGCWLQSGGSDNQHLLAATTTFNGTTFVTYNIDDPAAGQIGLGQVYRTVHNNLCYTIEAQYVGAEPNHYQGAERTRIQAENDAGVAKVESIAHTFIFTQ